MENYLSSKGLQGFVQLPTSLSSSSQRGASQINDQPKTLVALDPLFSKEEEEEREQGDFSIYIPLYDHGLFRGVWYRFRFRDGKHICMDDDGMKNGVVSNTLGENEGWRSSLTVLDNCVYKYGGPTDILVLDTKKVETTASSNYLLTWNKAPSTKISRHVPLITSLNRSIYVIDSYQERPFQSFETFDHGWGEVLRPQSTKWELLSSPPPRFPPDSYIFFHGVDELDKLIIGSLKEDVLYLYDAKTKELEKVQNLKLPDISYSSEDTIVVGKYLMWCKYGEVLMYDLVEKFLSRSTLEGIPKSVSHVETKLFHLSGDRFCYFILEDIEYERNSYLHLFEFSLGGEPPYESSLHPHVTSYFKYTVEKCNNIMNGILLSFLQ